MPSKEEAGRILETEITSEWQREEALVKRFKENKVFMTDGHGLKAEEPGFFRIIFSQEEMVIKVGLKRVGEVIGR